LLKKNYTVESLFFQNKAGFKGGLQFLTSIWNIKSAKRVQQKIAAFKPDVIHLHNWHFASGPLIIRCINKLGIPIVHTLHNYRLLCPSGILLNKQELFLDSLQQDFPFSAVKNKVYRNSRLQTFWLAFVVWFHKKIGTWQKVGTYICLSQNSLDLFKSSRLGVSKDKFVIKPNFTTKNSELRENIIRDSHFLFIGRLSKEKGIDSLIEAFKNQSLVLKIAGDGPMKEELLQITKKHKNIIYLGALTKKEVEVALQKAAALISPSICFETFGMTIIEAFSYKCAVITSNIGAPSTIVKDGVNGFQFEYGNVASLKMTIKKWTKLPKEKKNKIRNEGYNSYTNLYSQEKQFEYFKNIYI